MAKKKEPATSSITQPASPRLDDQTESTVAVIEIPVGKLHRDPRNPRKTIPESEIQEIADSIRARGIISPLAVRRDQKRKGEYLIIYGQCRHAGAIRAGLETVPGIVRDIDAETALVWMHIENLHRHSLSTVDEAESIGELYRRGKAIAEISALVGRSPAWVSARIKIAEMPDSVKDLLRADRLTVRQVEELAKIDDQEMLQDLSEFVSDGNMSIEQTRKEVESALMHLSKAMWDMSTEYSDKDGTIGACARCPHRTGSQAELFGDADGDDRCTDKGCWERKTAAYAQSVREALKAEKKKLADPRKVEAYGSPHFAKGKAEIALAKAAKAKPVYHVDKVGKVHELYPKPKPAEDAGKKIRPWDISNKAAELAQDAIRDYCRSNEAALQALYAICQNKAPAANTDIPLVLLDAELEHTSLDDLEVAIRAVLNREPEEFTAQAKVDLGVVDSTEQDPSGADE